ncbi:MAG: TRAP transporter substrate-binding protein [Pseudomonadota bacterium]
MPNLPIHMRGLRTIVAAAAVATLSLGAAQAADHTLRIHTLVTSPHPYNDMAAAMKEALEERSDGRIEVRVFDAGQLGQDAEVIGEVGLGTIDLMISSTTTAAKQIPEFQIFSMPYLFSDIDEMASKVGDGSPVKAHFDEVYDERGLGLKLLALTGTGTRNLSNAVKPIESAADISGMKMRTPSSTLDAETWAALDTLPVTVAWGELYAAMQTGVAEAMESSLPGYTGSKLYEVAPYLALTGHTIQGSHISMSQRSWDKLPEDLQTLVQEVANEAALLGLAKAKEYDGALVETLANEHGVTVTRPDVASFQTTLEPKQAELAQKLGLEEELTLIRQ